MILESLPNIISGKVLRSPDDLHSNLFSLLLDIDADWSGSSREQACAVHRKALFGIWTVQYFDAGSRVSIPINVKSIANFLLENDSDVLLLCHYHPARDAAPSEADFRTTRSIAQICSTLNIDLADHIIFSPAGCFSFRAAGHL